VLRRASLHDHVKVVVGVLVASGAQRIGQVHPHVVRLAGLHLHPEQGVAAGVQVAVQIAETGIGPVHRRHPHRPAVAPRPAVQVPRTDGQKVRIGVRVRRRRIEIEPHHRRVVAAALRRLELLLPLSQRPALDLLGRDDRRFRVRVQSRRPQDAERERSRLVGADLDALDRRVLIVGRHHRAQRRGHRDQRPGRRSLARVRVDRDPVRVQRRMGRRRRDQQRADRRPRPDPQGVDHVVRVHPARVPQPQAQLRVAADHQARRSPLARHRAQRQLRRRRALQRHLDQIVVERRRVADQRRHHVVPRDRHVHQERPVVAIVPVAPQRVRQTPVERGQRRGGRRPAEVVGGRVRVPQRQRNAHIPRRRDRPVKVKVPRRRQHHVVAVVPGPVGDLDTGNHRRPVRQPLEPRLDRIGQIVVDDPPQRTPGHAVPKRNVQHRPAGAAQRPAQVDRPVDPQLVVIHPRRHPAQLHAEGRTGLQRHVTVDRQPARQRTARARIDVARRQEPPVLHHHLAGPRRCADRPRAAQRRTGVDRHPRCVRRQRAVDQQRPGVHIRRAGIRIGRPAEPQNAAARFGQVSGRGHVPVEPPVAVRQAERHRPGSGADVARQLNRAGAVRTIGVVTVGRDRDVSVADDAVR